MEAKTKAAYGLALIKESERVHYLSNRHISRGAEFGFTCRPSTRRGELRG